MINALLDTNLCADLIFESADGERKSGESLVNLSEECAGALDLQVVLSIEFTLEDSGSEFTLAGLAFTCGDEDIETDNVTSCEFELLYALVGSLFVDDHLVSVDQVLLHLV